MLIFTNSFRKTLLLLKWFPEKHNHYFYKGSYWGNKAVHNLLETHCFLLFVFLFFGASLWFLNSYCNRTTPTIKPALHPTSIPNLTMLPSNASPRFTDSVYYRVRSSHANNFKNSLPFWPLILCLQMWPHFWGLTLEEAEASWLFWHWLTSEADFK